MDFDANNYLLHFDSATNLPNRFLLREQFAQAISFTQQTNDQDLLPFMLLELGSDPAASEKATGDKITMLLGVVGRQLLKELSGLINITRLDATRLVLMLTPPDGSSPTVAMVEQTREICQNVLRHSGSMATGINPKAGVTFYPCDGKDLATLLSKAEKALALAKRQENFFEFYTHESTPGSNLFEGEWFNREFTQNPKLEVFYHNMKKSGLVVSGGDGPVASLGGGPVSQITYQPQFSWPDGKLVGVEAVRKFAPGLPIRRNEQILINIGIDQTSGKSSGHPLQMRPGKDPARTPLKVFTPTLNANGLQNLCNQALWWGIGLGHASKVNRMTFSVTAQELTQPRFYRTVAQMLDSCQLPPEYISIQVSEDAVYDNEPGCLTNLRGLQALGIEIVLGGFGSGYSSFLNLENFQFDRVKIELNDFQRNLETSLKRKQRILQSAVLLAKDLDLEVTIGGIESARDKEILAGLSKDLSVTIQGSFIQGPLSAEDFEKLYLC